MPLTLHNLKPFPKSRKKRKDLGRGDASGHGTYSTKGQKGQKARSGGRKGLKLKGFKMILRRIPKQRGFKSPYLKSAIVNIDILETNFKDGDKVTPQTLRQKGLIGTIESGVKILGNGELTKKLIIEKCTLSEDARKKIERAGGEIH